MSDLYTVVMDVEAAIGPPGRPREFCADQALAAALGVFWSKGYEGASLSDLTEAMGISRPSLYAAFGNKEALFRKALDLYEREKFAFMRAALDAPTSRGVAEAVLRGALDSQTENNDRRGCLFVTHSVPCGTGAEVARIEVVARRAVAEEALLRRFERAKAEHDLPETVDALGLAQYLFAVVQGMAVQAGSGVPREQLERMVRTALTVWPGPAERT